MAVVAWFAAGTIWNVRQGRAAMRWMQDGLPLLGERSSVRWLGSSVVELVIRDARPPFASVTLVVFLRARDLPWGWIGRRRDTLIVRGVLRQAPAQEFEVLDAESWSGREALPRVPREWAVHEHAGLVTHHADAAALARSERMLDGAQRAGLTLHRLALHRNEPHFQLHVPLPDTARSARTFFEAVRGLATTAIA